MSAPGDTIRLAGGTYRENIVVDVPVRLTSDNGATIRGGYQGNVVHITASGTVLEGLHIGTESMSRPETGPQSSATASRAGSISSRPTGATESTSGTPPAIG